MTDVRQRIIAWARGEVGTVESPADSNHTKYGEWFGLNGVPWCGIFVSWCYAQAGSPLPNIGFKHGYAGCQTAVRYFTDNGLIVTDPEPGDIVFFDFNGDRRYDHTGLYIQESPLDPRRGFITIEGNTSHGNQTNGGAVMERSRVNKGVVFARVLPK